MKKTIHVLKVSPLNNAKEYMHKSIPALIIYKKKELDT